MTVKILVGNSLEKLRDLPDGSVHCCASSPPYWGLRDYGVPPSVWGGDPVCAHVWGETIKKAGGAGRQGQDGQRATRANVQEQTKIREGGAFCSCGAWRGAFGLEPTPQLYIEHLVQIFREVHRVLREDGVLWLNLGDSYCAAPKGSSGYGTTTLTGNGHYQSVATPSYGPRVGGSSDFTDQRIPRRDVPHKRAEGLKQKDLVGIPWMAAFALRDDGWWLRQDVIWNKPNPMPESVTDRCTKSHEYLFMLTKSETYYFDADAIAEPVTQSTVDRIEQPRLEEQYGSDRVPGKTNGPMKAVVKRGRAAGNKNHKYVDAYEASPTEEHRTKAGLMKSADTAYETRNKRSVWTVSALAFDGEFCRSCRTFFTGDRLRELRVETIVHADGRKERRRWCGCGKYDAWLSHFATFPPSLVEPCILAGCPKNGTVLDPFAGAGTTGLVADRLGRNAVLIELNPEYAEMARQRIDGETPLFSCVEAAE